LPYSYSERRSIQFASILVIDRDKVRGPDSLPDEHEDILRSIVNIGYLRISNKSSEAPIGCLWEPDRDHDSRLLRRCEMVEVLSGSRSTSTQLTSPLNFFGVGSRMVKISALTGAKPSHGSNGLP
jgi:hypothetical protein